jgi:hypothetical protein
LILTKWPPEYQQHHNIYPICFCYCKMSSKSWLWINILHLILNKHYNKFPVLLSSRTHEDIKTHFSSTRSSQYNLSMHGCCKICLLYNNVNCNVWMMFTQEHFMSYKYMKKKRIHLQKWLLSEHKYREGCINGLSL